MLWNNQGVFFYSNLERGIKNDFINQEFWKICWIAIG